MTEIIINAIILSLIATLASMIIDKKYSIFIFFSYIISVAISIVLGKYFIPASGGIAIAAIQGILIYMLSKNTVYATYMIYATYATLYVADLIAGGIYTFILKVKLIQYFNQTQGLLVYGILLIIISIPIIFALRYATEKIFRFKEIEIARGAKIAMYVSTPAALFVHAFLANRTRNSGIEEKMLKQSLLLNSTAVLIFMFGVYCILSICIKKDVKKGREIEKMVKDSTEEELEEIIKMYQQYKENKK